MPTGLAPAGRWRWTGFALAFLACLVSLPAVAFDTFLEGARLPGVEADGPSQHVQILARYGGAYDDPELSAYVSGIGARILRHAANIDETQTFIVLNSPVLNAFTAGEGYIYITRGMLAAINSEAELAAILAHEIGHVVERHSVKRQRLLKLGELEARLVASVASGTRLEEVVQSVNRALALRYSRAQEADADAVGIELLARAGYDPHAMPDMLNILLREKALMASLSGTVDETPAWGQDHPPTETRILSTLDWIAEHGHERRSEPRLKANHLAAINGLPVGQDPRRGLMFGETFVHPLHAIAFELPRGFDVQITQQAVMARHVDGAMVAFSGSRWPSGESLERYVNRIWSEVSKGQYGPVTDFETISVAGRPALLVTKKLPLTPSVVIKTVVYRFPGDRVFHFSFIIAEQDRDRFFSDFRQTALSLRKMSEQDLAGIGGQVLSVRVATGGRTASELASDMAVAEFGEEIFRALNGLPKPLELKVGDLYKTIAFEPLH